MLEQDFRTIQIIPDQLGRTGPLDICPTHSCMPIAQSLHFSITRPFTVFCSTVFESNKKQELTADCCPMTPEY
jgi:hypothetical protein